MGVTKRREPLQVNISVKGTMLKQVTSFKYPRSLLGEDRKCDKENWSRIGMTEANLDKMRILLASLNLNI